MSSLSMCEAIYVAAKNQEHSDADMACQRGKTHRTKD